MRVTRSRLKQRDSFALFQFPAEDFANGIFAEIRVGSESGDEKLGAFALVSIDSRGGDVVNN